MSVGGTGKQRSATPPLPQSIWVIAWASLAGQAVPLVEQGGRSDDEISLLVSVVLGGLLVGYVSVGVIRARAIRLGLAWVVLVLSLIGEIGDLVSIDDPGQATVAVFSLATTVVSLGALARFHRTDWFAWQRTRPSASEGPSIAGLVAVAVLVGVLGGLAGPVDDGLDVRIRVTGL